MIVPGVNLLGLASRVLRFQDVQHRAYTGRTLNSVGDYVSAFASPVNIQASVQPVEKKLYQELGLDLSRNYVYVWTSADIKPPKQGRAGDLLIFGGATYQAESDRFWRTVDGFTKLLAVEVFDL